MKKLLVLVAVAALFSTSALAAIQNTKHDLSSGSSATIKGTATEICVYCHTPHGAVNATTAPLWNRTTANATGFYNDPAGSLNAATTQAGVNASDAVLCLTCHDGASLSVALINGPNSSGGITGTQVGTNSNLGLDLSNDHPVGFIVSYLDTEIKTKLNIETGNMIGAVSYGTGNNEMWCSSCHDVHGITGVPYFLRVNNTGSALCLTCHNK